MPNALIIVACILFFILAVMPPYEQPSLPNRFMALGLFFFALFFAWSKL